MNSPFPGMDPYIEACGLWEGFHNHLVEDIYRTIAKVLPAGYIADTGVRSFVVVVEAEGKMERLAKPDVAVAHPMTAKKPRRKKGSVTLTEPTESVPMQAFIAEEFEESYVEIYAEGEERILVTCIEVLSPSNKRRESEGYFAYERKRQAMLLGRANFIEIDLLLGGTRMPMLTPWPDSPYTILVSRAYNAPHCRAWPAHFLRRLPVIPVPLLEPDPDLSLDLQPLIDEIYAIGRYCERIDYGRALPVQLPEADAAQVQELLRASKSPRPGGRRKPSL